ncbi:unnamed protein product [Rotaria socialis]|uniref:Uncharacterized protein n=1 Tax=Rotaria socialis TaxID=392032 RepID=A0A817WTQ0_9BILA|nr:unnamed protein product [Rotaria socialis]CAF4806178.1 unnamed protein product [Rotaria socialis]
MTGDAGPVHHSWLLDTVSVNDTANNANVLVNDQFETVDFTGWTEYFATDANCGGTGTNYGQLTASSCQSGTYCYIDKCNKAGNYEYLTILSHCSWKLLLHSILSEDQRQWRSLFSMHYAVLVEKSSIH